MALKCDVCDKKTVHGNTQIHRHSRWRFRAPKTKRTWVPNIRSVKIVAKEGIKEISMCMSCYKRYTKDGKAFLVRKQVSELKKFTIL
jgi:ribosomal protein L28